MKSAKAVPVHNHPDGPLWYRDPTVMDDLLNRKQGKKPKHVKMVPQQGATKGRQGSTISVASKASTYGGIDHLDTLQRTPSGRCLLIRDRLTIRPTPLKQRLAAVLGRREPMTLRSRRGDKYETCEWSTTRSGKYMCRTSERTILSKEVAEEIASLAAKGKDGIANKDEDEDYGDGDYTKNVPATRRVVRMHARRKHLFRRPKNETS